MDQNLWNFSKGRRYAQGSILFTNLLDNTGIVQFITVIKAHINSKHRVQPVPKYTASTLPCYPHSAPFPHPSFDIQEEQLNCALFQDLETFLFCYPSNSVIQPDHPHHGGRGEGGKGFPNPLCARRGRVMRTGRFCDSLIDLPALL